MGKGPLVTRSELRRRQREEEEALERNRKLVEKQSVKEYKKEKKQIDSLYRKKIKENKPMTKTRSSEKQRSRKMSQFLVRGIILVFVLLLIVMWMVLFF